MNPCKDCIVSMICIKACDNYKPLPENTNTTREYLRAMSYVRNSNNYSNIVVIKEDGRELEIWNYTVYLDGTLTNRLDSYDLMGKLQND